MSLRDLIYPKTLFKSSADPLETGDRDFFYVAFLPLLPKGPKIIPEFYSKRVPPKNLLPGFYVIVAFLSHRKMPNYDEGDSSSSESTTPEEVL